MRDRRVRVAVVGLMLVLPILMVGMNPRTTSFRASVLPVAATELILIGGLAAAGRERERLLAERSMPPARRAVPSFPHAPASQVLRRAPMGR